MWESRFREMRGLSLDVSPFGALGEMLVVSMLPDVTEVNAGMHQLLTANSMRWLTPEQRIWLANHKRIEIDVVFNGGRAIGEIKFTKTFRGTDSGGFIRMQKQAEKLRDLLQILGGVGSPKVGYFIFLGWPPAPEVSEMLGEVGMKVVFIPLDSSVPQGIPIEP